MPDILSELLSYPFEKEQIIRPQQGQKTLIWGAQYTAKLASIDDFDWVQSFKPYARELSARDIKSNPILAENKRYHMALCCLPKQKEESLFRLASCLTILEAQGILVAVAENNAGGKRLEKWFLDLGLKPNSLSKSKCRIVWGINENINEEQIKHFIAQGDMQSITLGSKGFFTKAGIYGWNKIDLGSKILVENIPNDLSGTGADFGCGYGYISKKILDGNGQIKKLYVIDADYHAIQCCQKNLEKYDYVECLWADLTARSENIPPLDWAIMNPPFHEGKTTNIDVGQKFIETAAHSLRKSGVLYMVANTHLPYEKPLKKIFSVVEKIVEKQGFKVFRAIK